MAKQKGIPAPVVSRVKAFVVDMFLIAAPLLYLVTYVFLNGKEDFQGSQIAISGVWLVFGLVLTAFFAVKAQSPGYKSQGIYAITLAGKKATALTYFARYLLFVLLFIFGGSLVACFRKDKRALHDILTGTTVVMKKE